MITIPSPSQEKGEKYCFQVYMKWALKSIHPVMPSEGVKKFDFGTVEPEGRVGWRSFRALTSKMAAPSSNPA
jgi:hypothetical protein